MSTAALHLRRAIACLAVEVPGDVWDDVNAKAEAALAEAALLRDELAVTMYQLSIADPVRWRLHKQGQPMRLRGAAR